MTDLSYEVNDEFDAAKAKNTIMAEMPLIALSEFSGAQGAAESANNGDFEQLIETNKVTEAVNTDRRLYLDFVVLKLMKRLRLCPFESMMGEVVPLLRFGLLRENLEPRIAYLCQIGRLEVFDEQKDGAMQVDEAAGGTAGEGGVTKMVKYCASE